MAQDATGTPTSPLGIPTYDTSQDAPTGKGFNAAMEFINDLIDALGGGGGGITDSDLIAIAALTPTADDVMQYKSGAWSNRTLTQLVADLTSDANLPTPPLLNEYSVFLDQWQNNLGNPTNPKLMGFRGTSGGGGLLPEYFAFGGLASGGSGLIAIGTTAAGNIPYFTNTTGSIGNITTNAATRSLIGTTPPAAGAVPYFSTTSAASTTASTSYGRALLNTANGAALVAALGLFQAPKVLTTSATLLASDPEIIHAPLGILITFPVDAVPGQKFTIVDHTNTWQNATTSGTATRVRGATGPPHTVEGSSAQYSLYGKSQRVTFAFTGTNWEILSNTTPYTELNYPFLLRTTADFTSGNKDAITLPAGIPGMRMYKDGSWAVGWMDDTWVTSTGAQNIPFTLGWRSKGNSTALGAIARVRDYDDLPQYQIERVGGPSTFIGTGTATNPATGTVTIGATPVDLDVVALGLDNDDTAWPNPALDGDDPPIIALTSQQLSGVVVDGKKHGSSLGRATATSLDFGTPNKLIGVTGWSGTVATVSGSGNLSTTPVDITLEPGIRQPPDTGKLEVIISGTTYVISYLSKNAGTPKVAGYVKKFNGCTIASGSVALPIGATVYQRIVVANGDSAGLGIKPKPGKGSFGTGIKAGEGLGRYMFAGGFIGANSVVGASKYLDVSKAAGSIAVNAAEDFTEVAQGAELSLATAALGTTGARERFFITPLGVVEHVSGISYGKRDDALYTSPTSPSDLSLYKLGQFSKTDVPLVEIISVDLAGATPTVTETVMGDATHDEEQELDFTGVTSGTWKIKWTTPAGRTDTSDTEIDFNTRPGAIEGALYELGSEGDRLLAGGDVQVSRLGSVYTIKWGGTPVETGIEFTLNRVGANDINKILGAASDGQVVAFKASTAGPHTFKHATTGTDTIECTGSVDQVLGLRDWISFSYNATTHRWEQRNKVATSSIGAGSITRAMLADAAALSVIGRSANSTGVPADIAAATDGHVLRRSGTTLGFGTVDPAGITPSGTNGQVLTTTAGATGWATPSTTPGAHHTTHESGGSDSIKLDDLSAPDDNTDLNATTLAHGLLKKLDGTTTNFLRGDGTWQAPPTGGTPSAHHTTHESGGSDAIKLDDLSAPDDNTDLNASTSAHGLLKKLDNNAAHYMDGTGAWSTPASGSSNFVTPEDFGAVGNGSTDDSTAITNWLASDSPKRAPLDADTKNYLVAGTFTIAQSDDIDFGGATLSCKNSSTTKIVVTAANVTLRNLIFDGRRTGTSVVSRGIEWQAAGGRMIDCEVSNHNDTDAAILVNATGAELTCVRCAAHNNGARATGDSGSVLRVPTAETTSISYGVDGFSCILGRLETYDCKANYNSRCGLYTSETADENCVVDLVQCKGNYSALIRTNGSPSNKNDRTYNGSAAAVCLRSNRGVVHRVIVSGKDASNADATRYGMHIGAYGGGTGSQSGENWKVDLVSFEDLNWVDAPTSAAECFFLRGGHNTHVKTVYANNCQGYALAFGGGANNTGSGDNAIPTGHRIDQVHARQVANPSVSVSVGRNISIGHIYMYGAGPVDIGEGTQSIVDTVSIDKISAFGCTSGVFVNTGIDPAGGGAGSVENIHVGTIEAHDCTSTVGTWPNALVWLIGKTWIDRVWAETKSGGTKPNYIVKSEDSATTTGRTHFIGEFEPISYNTAPTLIANTSNIVIRLQPYTASKALVTDASGYLTPSTVTAAEVGYLSGVTTPTGTGALVLATSPTLVTPSRSTTPSTDDSTTAIATTAHVRAQKDRQTLCDSGIGFGGITFDERIAVAAVALTSQRVTWQGIGLKKGDVISNIYLPVTTNGSGETSAYVGVATVSGTTATVVAVSSDIKAGLETGSVTRWQACACSYTVPSDGFYYLFVHCIGGTPVALARQNPIFTADVGPNGIPRYGSTNSVAAGMSVSDTKTVATSNASTHPIAWA